MASDPQAYAAWLDSIKPKYGGWTTPMDMLGAFNIFSSLWFKLIIGLLTTSILACSVNRFKGLWKTAVHPRTRKKLEDFGAKFMDAVTKFLRENDFIHTPRIFVFLCCYL